jgi:malate dehydrogenase (oxaloacetate-decarboxylating)(NADP+)
MAKIMLADDDSVTRILLESLLSARGYEVFSYDCGNAILDNFASIKPDVVLLDVQMPDIDGIDVCVELRKRPESYNVPIAIVSASEDEDDIIKGLTSGADEYLLKPIRASELMSKVSLLLSKRNAGMGSNMAENVVFAGRFLILKVLGEGGFSTVYLAKNLRDEKHQKVALKILAAEKLQKKDISRFLQETYGLSLLNHPNIVKLIEFGSYAGKYFLVTEYLEGQSLNTLVKNSPLSEKYALYVAEEVLNALKCMNIHNIIHRDIKPDNLIIRPGGKIVLIDFGLAKDENQQTLSYEGEMRGTPQFMAPEYISNSGRQNIKVDIYSLGVTLFYAVSGELPFKGEAQSIINDHLNTVPPKLAEIVPFMVSADFSAMISKMLIKDPRRRCSLEELESYIQKCKSGEKDFMSTDNHKELSMETEDQKKQQLKKNSLKYHETPSPGKISLMATKPCESQADLSLAYTPGVACPCLEIKDNPETVWNYTSRGNMVAVVSDGTAVLGLGNIGPEAGMPVMEGKGVLFKHFADVDAVPICLSKVFGEDGRTDAKSLIETVERLEPTFGGINLEDIAAPACFEIEQTLKKSLAIPVFHDDQHGTAIISLAGIINALKLVNKKIEDCRFVVNGAGAAGIACSEFYISAGAKRENFVMCDSRGVIYKGRETGMTPEKERFAADTEARTLADAMKGADVFVGVSKGDVVSKEMVQSMAENSVVFAMANPTPEINPALALEAGAAVVGTGRTDYPNQVNNVLGFPGIFRGALDVRAKDINLEMQLAAAKALAEIVSEKIPDNVYDILSSAYPQDARAGMFDGNSPLKNTFVIPKPFDPRVVPRVARYVAQAAMETGMAQVEIKDFDAYEKAVTERIRRNCC